MIIAGAGGFAKELYSEWKRDNPLKKCFFYDDVNHYESSDLFDTLILNNQKQIIEQKIESFLIGTGNPKVRKIMWQKMLSMGLKPETYTSSKSSIGQYNVNIGLGCVIMAGNILTTCIDLSKGILINIDCTVGHDTSIGEFCEICPGVHIAGGCKIGDYVFIGTGAVILPYVKIGTGAVVAAGAVVKSDVPENTLVAGIPSEIKKQW